MNSLRREIQLVVECPQLKLVKTWQHKFARTLETMVLKATKTSKLAGEWLTMAACDVVIVIDHYFFQLENGELQPSIQTLRRMGCAPQVDRSCLGKAGSAAYVASEAKRVLAGIALIEDKWADNEIKTNELLQIANVSYGVAKRHLGSRRRYTRMV